MKWFILMLLKLHSLILFLIPEKKFQLIMANTEHKNKNVKMWFALEYIIPTLFQ